MRNFSTKMLTAFAFVALLCSCTQKVTRPTPDRYRINVSDNVDERRFDVHLESNDSRALCISTENWPNSSGQFSVEKSDTFVQIGANRLPAKSKLMSAYCPGGCGEHRIKPGGSLHGFISYEVFDDPDKLATETDKHLSFPVTPYHCD